MNPNSLFWQHKKVVITGHSGFKGAWLSIWLQQMGARVLGISLPPLTEPNLFTLAKIDDLCEESYFCDIRDAQAVEDILVAFNPEVVFHLAAQPLVRASYRDPLTTFGTNVMGTAHVLEALRKCSATKVALMVTTDKVYKNNEWLWPYREDDALGGHDPYSSSKAASELVIESFRQAFLQNQGVTVASARAGNVIGGGDWSEDRLIPDAVRAWQSAQILEIRSPEAIRPWQHVLEPLTGYLLLAEKLWEHPEYSGAYNFGPHTQEAATVKEVIEIAQSHYADAVVRFGQEQKTVLHEAKWLALETAKAKYRLGHVPRWDLSQAVGNTINWYRKLHEGVPARELCLNDISNFLQHS